MSILRLFELAALRDHRIELAITSALLSGDSAELGRIFQLAINDQAKFELDKLYGLEKSEFSQEFLENIYNHTPDSVIRRFT